jgi:hypothetical protein
MSTYRRVLALVGQGTSLPRIADRLDTSEDAVLAMIESMVRSGHLQDLDCAEGACSACPMSDGCPVPDGPSQYFLTENGRALVEDTDRVRGADGSTAPPKP